jgi:hypothetical protein
LLPDFFEYGQSVDVTAQFQIGNNDIDLPAAHNLQRVFSGIDSDCLCTQFFKRFGNSIRMVALIVNNQDYICLLLQIDTSLGLDRSGLSLSKLVSPQDALRQKLEARSRKLEKTSFESRLAAEQVPGRASIRASTTLNEK